MGLFFRNNTNRTVYVAYGYLNFDCGPVTYAKRGWYRIDPGQTRLVRRGYVGGRTYYFYAEDAFGRRWSGAYFTDVPQQAFNWCWNTGCTTCRNVGFRRFRVGALRYNYTITLSAGTSRSTSKTKSKSAAGRVELPTRGQTDQLVRKVPKAPSQKQRALLEQRKRLRSRLKRKR